MAQLKNTENLFLNEHLIARQLYSALKIRRSGLGMFPKSLWANRKKEKVREVRKKSAKQLRNSVEIRRQVDLLLTPFSSLQAYTSLAPIMKLLSRQPVAVVS